MQKASIFLVFLAAACCSDSYTHRSEASFLKDVISSSVLIQTEAALGSGTVIMSDTGHAWVLTCHHVITEDYGTSKLIHVSSPLFNTFNVTVVADDPDHDLALLSIRTNTRAPHVDVAKTPPELYSRVYMFGNPLGDQRLVSEAFISNLNEPNPELPQEHLYTLTGGYLLPGISGGSAVNQNGELVCVPSNGRTYGGNFISNMGYCVSLKDIQAFLNKVKWDGVVYDRK